MRDSISIQLFDFRSAFAAYFSIYLRTRNFDTTGWKSILALHIEIISRLCIFNLSSLQAGVYVFFPDSSQANDELALSNQGAL